MWLETRTTGDLFYDYRCFSIKCMVNNDFPRYICGTDKEGNVCWQEYAADNYYVKVSDQGSHIYTLRSCILDDETVLSDPLWIDSTNLEDCLDRVKGLHYILWNG
jgi:hypothetical protein